MIENSENIIVFRIGWMEHYQGPQDDDIYSSAQFIQSEEYGHEMYNFLPYEGYMYGFVQPSGPGEHHQRNIRIERLGVAKESEDIQNVLVAWVAPKTQGGTFLIGWYKNATVFRAQQKPPQDSGRLYEGDVMGYYAKAYENHCVLLPLEERTLQVPRATKNLGGIGQSLVWYADSGKPNDLSFRENLLQFVENYESRSTAGITTRYTFVDNSEDSFSDELLAIPELKETTKQRLQSTRIGQEKFRRNLLRYWQGRCAVTGFDDTRLLRASHIKPWRDSEHAERLDPFNGLLLIPNIDEAFDKGLITFDAQGLIMISSSFQSRNETLGITENMQINLDERHDPYLEYHRQNIFRP